MRVLSILLLLATTLVALAVAIGPRLLLRPMPVADLARPHGTAPGEPFAPERWFAGRTESIGVIESPSGEPLRRIRTATSGTLADGVLTMEQTLMIEGEAPRTRQWRVARQADGSYRLDCDDMAGPARGEVAGRSFRMEYDLRIGPDGPFGSVHAVHWMHVQDDGATLLNRVVFTKLGAVVASVSESFRRVGD